MDKSLALPLCFAWTLFGAWSHAAEPSAESSIDISCSEKYLDHGVNVALTALPTERTTTAVVYVVTFVETITLGRFDLDRPAYPRGQPVGAELHHRSADGKFRLDLRLTEPAERDEVAAEGAVRAVVGSDGQSRVTEAELFCTIYRNGR
ncbi:hypothetical protein [Sorangium sp. So ce1182]|uniref:hypothetical protein n=1 Tax=Sorangium sp. So ce1182 TaxID=3133334 RepID=UPI003F6218ED